jgi:hypothetical protein
LSELPIEAGGLGGAALGSVAPAQGAKGGGRTAELRGDLSNDIASGECCGVGKRSRGLSCDCGRGDGVGSISLAGGSLYDEYRCVMIGVRLFSSGVFCETRRKSSTTAALSSSLALEARRLAGFANLRRFGIVDHRFFALFAFSALAALSFSSSFSSSLSILPPMRSNVFLRVKGGADKGTGDATRVSFSK